MVVRNKLLILVLLLITKENIMKVIREFTCGISGDKCAIVLKNGEEICILAKDIKS